ncbi:MAG: hypothetical protein M1821_002401 [Bathelium mastoideum]|nr:MAG: hypothetical protein M1821_002401 [Bathelium mastoideum]KAI9686389.1 MAG: hypothetical protein M1822_003734 [Bathelium mastoideum]
MAPTAAGESSQAQRRKATRTPSGAGKKVVPVIPLTFPRPSPKKNQSPDPASHVEPPPQSTVRDGQDLNPAAEPTTDSVSNTKIQPASELSGVVHSTKTKSGGSGSAGPSEVETGQQQQATQHPQLDPGTPSENLKFARMSQIQAQELPPPFYPSGSQPVPLSAASSNLSAALHGSNASFNGSSHASQPSMNGIVFGGYADSTSSSPALPVPADSHAYPPPPPVQHISYGSQVTPAFVPPSHARFASGSHPFAAHPAPTNVQPYDAPQFFRQPAFQGPPPLHPHPPHQWSPAGAQDFYNVSGGDKQLVDGGSSVADGPQSISRSTSAISSGARDADKNRTSTEQLPYVGDPLLEAGGLANVPVGLDSNPSELHRRQSTFGLPAAGQPYMPANVEEDSSAAIRDYLCAHFGNSEFADYMLHLTHTSERFPPLLLPVHGIIVSRSPLLAQLIKSSATSAYNMSGNLKMLALSIEDRFINGIAFADALRNLYGFPLINANHFTLGFVPPSLQLVDEALKQLDQRADYTFAYIASGYQLQLDGVASRGLDMATRLLRWETVEKALAFALHGGLSPSWKNDDSPEDRDSVTSSEESSSRPETSQSSPTYGPYGTRLLHNIVDFLVYYFPMDFHFDASAPQLKATPRLPPSLDQARPTTNTTNTPIDTISPLLTASSTSSNPRLSQIQFGDVPPLVPTTPTTPNAPTAPASTLLSATLLSLPFPVLKAILEHAALTGRLGAPVVVALMHQVVDAREARRSHVLRSRISSVATGRAQDFRTEAKEDVGEEEALARNAAWEEGVERSGRRGGCGWRLVRRRKGVDTPASGASRES